MAPERKFYQKIKRNFTEFSLIRLENNSLLGTPDLLVYNANGHFFTIELKVTKSNKVTFSPHQISFHVRHPNNSFIMVEALGPCTVKLFRGSRTTWPASLTTLLSGFHLRWWGSATIAGPTLRWL